MHHLKSGIINKDPVSAGTSGIYTDTVTSNIFSYQLAHVFEKIRDSYIEVAADSPESLGIFHVVLSRPKEMGWGYLKSG
jgi:hypothetical protein